MVSSCFDVSVPFAVFLDLLPFLERARSIVTQHIRTIAWLNTANRMGKGEKKLLGGRKLTMKTSPKNRNREFRDLVFPANWRAFVIYRLQKWKSLQSRTFFHNDAQPSVALLRLQLLQRLASLQPPFLAFHAAYWCKRCSGKSFSCLQSRYWHKKLLPHRT